MIAGHFGLAAGVKRIAPRLPLWALLLGTFLLDIVFIFFAAVGLEKINPVDPVNPNAYGGSIIHAEYTHSFVGALLIAGVAGFAFGRFWGKRGGSVIAAVVFSHWVLDLIVHRPDIPILPGNFGNLPLLGFGLWQYPTASAIVELVLVVGGSYYYYRSAMGAAASSKDKDKQQLKALTCSIVTTVLLLLLLTANVLSL